MTPRERFYINQEIKINIVEYPEILKHSPAEYKTLEEAVKEYNRVEATFEDHYGKINFCPDNEGTNYYYNNIIVKRKYTTFIYNCRRFGLVDADYFVTNYIIADDQIIKISDEEIIIKLCDETL